MFTLLFLGGMFLIGYLLIRIVVLLAQIVFGLIAMLL